MAGEASLDTSKQNLDIPTDAGAEGFADILLDHLESATSGGAALDKTRTYILCLYAGGRPPDQLAHSHRVDLIDEIVSDSLLILKDRGALEFSD